jgi:pSer/pThr/pTyr-binding forkhead associated (FHA) protein
MAQRTLPKAKVSITKFPFRIGRSGQQKGPDILQCNDLSLVNIDPAQVAKNHISIEKDAGVVLVRDRNTRRGTLVNGKRLHQETGELVCPLIEGENEVVLGDASNKAVYRLSVTK